MATSQPGMRVSAVHSEERQAFERAQRVKAMDRVRTRLEKLQRRVATGKLKAAEKVGAAAVGTGGAAAMSVSKSSSERRRARARGEAGNAMAAA